MNSDNAREARAIVTGLGLVCFALFLGVSLYTHSASDALDYHAAQSQEIQNKAGLIGAQLAHYAFCLYGIGAWVLAVVMLVCGSSMCAMRSMSGFLPKAVGAILLMALVCTWTAALDRRGLFSEDYPAGPGGLLGSAVLAPPLIAYFGRVGVFLVLAACGLLCCLLLAPALTEIVLALVGRGVVNAMHWGVDLALGRSAPQPAFVPAEPALATAGVSARRIPSRGAEEDAESHFENVRPLIAQSPPTRRLRIPLADLEKRDAEDLLDEPADEAAPRRLPGVRKAEAENDRLKDIRKPARTVEVPDAEDETDRRRQMAVDQAEAAEATRLEREKKAQEQQQREMKALEKLEKERAGKDAERAKQQSKFAAVLAAEAAAAASADADSAAQPPAKPKPQLPDNYELPKYDLLIENDITPTITSEAIKERGATVVQTLWDFKIGAKLVDHHKGPTVTMYELELDAGVKVQRVVQLQDNLAIALKADNGVRVVYPIPGKSTIGIEVPNAEDHTVRMRPILESPDFRKKNWALPLILGRDSVGHPLVADLAPMPHLLIAGTTGSGKSVCVNSIILSMMILRRPHEVKLILVDPKQVEMTDFKDIPHLLCPVVTDMKLAAGVLTWAVQKMEERFEKMAKLGVRNLATFNKMSREDRLAKLPAGEPPEDFMDPMPYIVVVVDEFADLMMVAGKEIEQAVQRLAQKARAAGIHVILATQRPSADVVTGIIKANFPCRICFQVKSRIDSQIVLETTGAQKLAGKGDMLYMGPGTSALTRAKGVYIADDEIHRIVGCCKKQAQPVYSDEIERVATQVLGEADAEDNNRQAVELDEKFDEAVETLLAVGRASTSLLQRRLGLGYTRAAKVLDQMECRGIVGPDRGVKGRELLISVEQWDQYKRSRNNAAANGGNGGGSAWGPRGSKDNPIAASSADTASAPAPAVTDSSAALAPAATAVAEATDAKPGEDINPQLLAQLDDVDGVKTPGDDDDEM
jgi:DNA segregation ATPase FtsK/SpoIIIE-like protein